jgi:CRISPR/Cas system CMR subunit Cmr6 (Cas7 group RAMP superfamily)
MLKVKINFKLYSQESTPDSESKEAFSWVSKEFDSYEMCINEKFWLRFQIANEEEKQIIRFAIALCIVHEMAHFAAKWSRGKKYAVKKFFQNKNTHFQHLNKNKHSEFC